MKRIVSGLMLILLLINTLIMAFNIQPVKATTVIVPDDYSTIQQAINAASPGDTIYVRAGTYYENVIVDKTVSLVGENRHETIINGDGTADTVVTVRADSVIIEEFTIKNSGQWRGGIWVYSQDNVTIQNNSIINNYYGIILAHSLRTIISNNRIANGHDGVLLYNSSETRITGNEITANDHDGIWLHDAPNNSISDNNITATVWYGIEVTRCAGNNITGNNITGGAPPSVTGIMLWGPLDQVNTICGNNIINNSWGIGLYNHSNINISGNNIANNGYGIYLGASYNNNIIGNNITASNYDGIRLFESFNNNFYYNNFVNNSGQVYDGSWDNPGVSPSINVWDDGYPSGGNYWSDYTGVDYYSGPNQDQSGSDGIGDTPYIIDDYNRDQYPLMNPYVTGFPVHNLNTGENFVAIQSAIEDSDTQSGHIITVDPGIYFENIVVFKSLTIKSTSGDPSNTIIMAKNPDYAVFSVEMVNYVNIDGFTIKGATEWAGIALTSASNCTVSNNIISDNYIGISLGSLRFDSYIVGYSRNNTITCNNIRANTYGIVLEYVSYDNKIYHNNFINNAQHADVYPSAYVNFWDDSYPSGGNYWSDYTDVDLYSGPYQNETGSDGIWDHPYVIDDNNRDRYPLMKPWSAVETWTFDSDFQYNLDDNYETVEGTGHLSGSATLSDGNLSIEGQVTINGPLPSAIPEVYIIATDGQDKELTKKIVDFTYFSYWQTGQNTYGFSGTVADAPQPINNGHYEVSALITYGGTKYHFFINTASKISKHYFPLIPAALPTIPAQPVNLSPADGATDVSVTPVLVASPPLQDVPDELIPWEEIDGYIARVYSQWQVTTIPGDYSNPVYNETILGLISRWNRPEVWSTAIWDSLDYGTTYYWRVRYKDFRGIWSPWSEETSFTTIPWVLETDFSREIQFTVDETKRHIDSILEEARTSAKDGDYFATRFKAEQIDLIVDSIFDAFGTLSAAVPGGEDVIDLWKVSLSGGPDTPYAHILWFKHVYHDALFSSGEPSATTMDMLRWALTYYAADITGEAPERISVETLKLTLKNILRSSLALRQSFVPSLERLVKNLKKDLDNTLSDVLAQIRDLTPEEVEAYRQDLLARRKANDVLLGNLWQLALPLHQSRVNWDQPGWKAKITQFFIRNLLRVLIGLVSDGPGVLIYSLGTLGWDAFQNMAELTEAAKMMDLAVAVVGNTFDTSRRIFLNTIRGLENIKHRVTPQIGQGEIVSINNMVIGEYKQFLGRWDLFIKEAFSDVTISNTGTANTIYELTATYGKWGILGTSYTSLISQKSLRINAGRTYTMRIYYYEEGRYGEIPSKGTEIEFTLLGTTETGTYYIGTAKTTFGTTVLADTKGLTISQHEMEESQIIPYPIRSFVENSLNSDVYTLKICIENPFNITVLGNITQQFPTSITILDANGGIFNENQVSWQITLDPGETRQYNVTFICQAAPGTIVEIQGATLNIYDPFADDIVSFETDSISLEAKFPVIVRAFPPVQASIREEIKVPMNVTNLSDDAFNGNITLEFSDFEGNIIYNSTYELYLMPKETKEIELLAAPNISAGIYVIKGILTKGEARTTVFAEYISIDASNVIGVALLAGRNNHKGSIIKLGDYITSTNPDGSYIFLGIPAGNYILTITHHGYASIMQEVTVNPYGFTVLQQYSLIDIGIPPKTLLEVSEPKFVAANMTYVTSATLITLVAEDNPGGSGVASTACRIYNATYDSGWITYTQPFYLTGLSDGTYYIDYNSTDYAGNMEPTNTVTVILDNTPPTTTLNIGEPKYVTDITYVTSQTLFTLEAYDNAGSGIYSIAYRIYNDSHDSRWLPYTEPFYLAGLADGAYTIEFNSTDNLGNKEPTNSIQVTLFSWNYIFEDTYGRGTTLKINTKHKFFQFITPKKDFGIRNATYMRQCGRAIIIKHYDSELRLNTIAVDTKLDFCIAIAWDLQARKCYILIDKPGIEK